MEFGTTSQRSLTASLFHVGFTAAMTFVLVCSGCRNWTSVPRQIPVDPSARPLTQHAPPSTRSQPQPIPPLANGVPVPLNQQASNPSQTLRIPASVGLPQAPKIAYPVTPAGNFTPNPELAGQAVATAGYDTPAVASISDDSASVVTPEVSPLAPLPSTDPLSEQYQRGVDTMRGMRQLFGDNDQEIQPLLPAAEGSVFPADHSSQRSANYEPLPGLPGPGRAGSQPFDTTDRMNPEIVQGPGPWQSTPPEMDVNNPVSQPNLPSGDTVAELPEPPPMSEAPPSVSFAPVVSAADMASQSPLANTQPRGSATLGDESNPPLPNPEGPMPNPERQSVVEADASEVDGADARDQWPQNFNPSFPTNPGPSPSDDLPLALPNANQSPPTRLSESSNTEQGSAGPAVVETPYTATPPPIPSEPIPGAPDFESTDPPAATPLVAQAPAIARVPDPVAPANDGADQLARAEDTAALAATGRPSSPEAAAESLAQTLALLRAEANENRANATDLRLLQLLEVVIHPAAKWPAKSPADDVWKRLATATAIQLRDQDTLEAREHVQAALAILDEQAPLRLANLAFCRQIDDFGIYAEFKASGFQPGQELLLYVELENFTHSKTPNGHTVEIAGSYDIVNEDGDVVETREFLADKQTFRRKRRDYYVPYRLFVPKEIADGQYTLVLNLKDVASKKKGTASIALPIQTRVEGVGR